jgi:hypothetical protein
MPEALFSNSLFNTFSLTAYVNNLQYAPHELGTYLPWHESGISTSVAVIEERDGKIIVVPAVERGSAPTRVLGCGRRARPIIVPHYPLEYVIKASEVSGVRAFGQESGLETVEMRRNEKLEDGTKSQEVTREWVRAGAITGQIRDHDGSLIYDMHAEFGVNRNTHGIDLNNPNTDVLAELIEAKEKAEDELGGFLVNGFELPAGKTLFKKIVSHPSVKKAWDRWQDGAALRADNRKGFEIVEGVTLRSYAKGKLNGVNFMDPTKGYLCPIADGLYETRYAPAETNDWVNTVGLPIYTIPETLEYNAGVKMLIESNQISWVNVPRAIVEISQL